jgi:hypothetical protein
MGQGLKVKDEVKAHKLHTFKDLRRRLLGQASDYPVKVCSGVTELIDRFLRWFLVDVKTDGWSTALLWATPAENYARRMYKRDTFS